MQIKGSKILITKPMKKDWLSWLPVLFWVVNLYRMTDHGTTIYLGVLYVTGIIGLVKLVFDKKILNSALTLTIVIYIFTELINCIIIGNVGYRDLVNDLLLFGVLVAMFVYPQTYKNGLVCFYVSAFVFLTVYFRGGYASTILISSGNYVSVLLVLSCAYYYLCIQNSNHEFRIFDILPAMLSFLLSIWARGRGGILSCSVLLVLILVYYLRSYAQKSTRNYIIMAIAVIIFLAVMSFRNVNIFDSFMNLGKWQSRGTDNTAREIIWGSYFNKTKESIVYLFFGTPLKYIPVIVSYNYNTHNSFLQLHACNGLIALLAFLIVAIKSLIYEFKNGQHLIAIAMISVIIRGMTDKFIFGQYGMPIMLYLVLWPYMESYVKSIKQ
ncbi:O-antigen ligase family protein [Roseburia hominis]